jgi:methylenetetrahydrofolate dehydrogenase (NADP+)/methenyltetrahydrofolate cyclohydrolase
MTTLLNGKEVSEAITDQLTKDIAKLSKKPGLAVILVGANPASQLYVGSKKRTCEKIGMTSFEYLLPDTTTEAELITLITTLNHTPDVHGILLQLPLPNGLDSDKMLGLISPDKDVDGFHPMSVGKLLQGLPTFKSCTPFGVMEILRYYGIPVEGKHVVIVGRSNIVGKPLAAMMLAENATVTICHSKTKNLSEITRQADILCAAIGRANFITKDMVKDGAVVIDVGINRIEDKTTEKGYKIVGDVDYAGVSQIASAITPVPGGVGPMTIAMLMKNTLHSFNSSQS